MPIHLISFRLGLLTFTIVAFTVFGITPGHTSAGLLDYYTLDETTGDDAGSTGTRNTTGDLSPSVFNFNSALGDGGSVSDGVDGNALRFDDGSDNRQRVTFTTPLLQLGTDSFTINLWARRDRVNDWDTLVYQKAGTDGINNVFARVNNTNTMLFVVGGDSVVTTETIAADGEFHMYTFVRDTEGGNNILRLYIDGGTPTTNNIGGSPTNIQANGEAYFGSQGTGSSSVDRYFDGTLDEILIADIVASPELIEYWYNNPGAQTLAVPEPAAIGMLMLGLAAVSHRRRNAWRTR